jgi:ribonuclease HII
MPERHSSLPIFPNDRMDIERELCTAGYRTIAGVDEAGRGPLAGPVVAAAVIFSDCDVLWSARDSKKMSLAAREAFFAKAETSLIYGLGVCSPEEIDSLNILQASMLAMSRAVLALPARPDMVLVDGNRKPAVEAPCRAIVRGDARVAVIGAASIMAKVTRDRMMGDYHVQYPHYGFNRHFGYPTEEHRRLIQEIGPCPIHRRTFHGVREYIQDIPER